MSALSSEEIGQLLDEYFSGSQVAWQEQFLLRPHLLPQLAVYLDLLVKWNQRTNLSAIRDPERMVTRHFGESLFAASFLEDSGTLLDLGSGAGFPGIPIQLWRPDLEITLAESQGKKAAFLREVVRTLGLPTQVWAGRAESIPKAVRFGAVVMRAVDNPLEALRVGLELSRSLVWVLGSEGVIRDTGLAVEVVRQVPVPGSERSFLSCLRSDSVPRGT